MGIFLSILGLAVALLALGLQLGGVESAQWARVCFVLAGLSFVGALGAFFWSWIGAIFARATRWWAWFRQRAKDRWPLALSRTARQLRSNNKRLETELKASSEQREADKIALEKRNRELSDKVEGLIFSRCIELGDELFGFLEERSEQDSDETMRQYKEQFKDKVDLLRVSLIQNGGWNPRADRKGQLEYPGHPTICSA